ncbi:hypothetical protein OAT67_07985 [Bacteriovoracaceae bacterium]|nr:hypothetical protein [Bacteriovoracaceae bacterium]
MAKKGFFRMGELTGMSMDLNTTNDNIGHGLYRLFGGEADSIEGDDRGSTFGIDGKVSLAFEKGEISLKSFSKGYGRNAPQPRTFMIGDTEYQSSLRYYTDEEGKYYLEFLNYEGVELEVKRFIGESDTYVRITPGMTVKDDQSGLAKEMQDGWHEMTKEQGTIIYHYLDHMEKKTSYNLGLEIGQEFVLSESVRSRTSLDYSGGVNLATGDDSDRYFQGDVVIKYERFGLDDKDKLSLPGFEAKLSLGGKYYLDDEKDSAITIDVKKRFQVGKKSYLYLRTGVGYIDDRYSREYGNVELSNNGRLDLQYNYGIGFEIEL